MTRIVVNRKYLLYMSIIYQDRQVVQFPSKNGPKIPYPQLNLKKLSAPPPPYQAEIPPPFGFFKNFLSPSLLKKKGGRGEEGRGGGVPACYIYADKLTVSSIILGTNC